jgi:NAD(P)-dependent dehydrogenase (short-subunit alcohol dehydrogenase family)
VSADEFRGRTALVTGGSAGLGRHLVRSLVSLGANVAFCSDDAVAGEVLAAELGEGVRFLACDLADAEACRTMVQAAGEWRGRLDYLVNNAAVDPEEPFSDITPEILDRVLAVDIRAYFLVTQAALPYLDVGEGRAIVNIGSTNCMHGWAGATAYNAAKGGIIGFSRSLARDLGPRRIRVNVVSPGWIMTERQLREKVTEADKQDLLRRQSLKTLLTEHHVTPVTLFLLSRAAAAVTGQNLVVDGGFYLQ